MKINFRKAKKEDFERIDQIYSNGVIDEIQLQYPERSRLSIIRDVNKERKKRLIDWKKELNSQKSYWIVAEKNNKIIGFGNAEIKNKNEGWLTMLYIDRGFRGKGIGKSLTKERINWLKKKKINEIWAGMVIKNKKSINNLKKFGFIPVSIKMRLLSK